MLPLLTSPRLLLPPVVLGILLGAGLVTSAQAENARLEALRQRLVQKHEAVAAKASAIQWAPTQVEGTWTIPEDCVGRFEKTGSLAGKAIHPYSCGGGEAFDQAAATHAEGWTFLRDCRPVHGDSRAPIENCLPHFVGFYRKPIPSMKIEASFLGICRMFNDNVVVGGLPLPKLPAVKDIPGIPAPDPVKALPAPGPIAPSRPFVMTPLKEGGDEGWYFGQLAGARPHGFGFGVFPGKYAFVGFAREGWTEGWNVNLNHAKHVDGSPFLAVTGGNFAKGYPQGRGSQIWLEPGRQGGIHRVQVYLGEFDVHPHGQGVWRRLVARGYGSVEDLVYQGTFDKGKYQTGRLLEGYGSGKILSTYDRGKRTLLVRWKKVEELAFSDIFRHLGGLHAVSAQHGDGRIQDEDGTFLAKGTLVEVPVDTPAWLHKALISEAKETGQRLLQEEQKRERERLARLEEQRKASQSGWGGFFGRGTRGGSGDYAGGSSSSGYDSSSRHNYSTIGNYKKYLEKAINGQTSGGYNDNVMY